MSLIKRIMLWLMKAFLALVFFFALCVVWGMLLMQFWPWDVAGPSVNNSWPSRFPLPVSNAAGQTIVMSYKDIEVALKQQQVSAPWPAAASGEMEIERPGQKGKSRLAWTSVAGKPWRFELKLDERDYIYQVRYRLDGDKPVLVESRVRGPQIGFLSVPLALLSVIVWKTFAWWRRRSAVARADDRRVE